MAAHASAAANGADVCVNSSKQQLVENAMNPDHYFLAKTLHIIAMTAWMAGMFYLPRLFAYHAEQPVGSRTSELFKLMEWRLLRIIINPAMIATWCFGLWLILITGAMKPGEGNGWLYAKLSLLVVMQLLHAYFARTRKKFDRDERPRSAKFYKVINEMVTVVFIGIVALVVFKPF
jgi:putative membrane protein